MLGGVQSTTRILKLTQLISLLSSTTQAVLQAKIDFEAKLFVSANNTPGCHVQMRTKMVDTKSYKQTLLWQRNLVCQRAKIAHQYFRVVSSEASSTKF